ncbi:MAG: ATP-binding protein, partial [Saprospiraceae bacterium]
IYLILREAIFNVAKYSEASHCFVTADVSNKNMQIQIKDDGIGFDTIAASLGGNGLLNMKQRADELNGKLEIQSGNQNGTSIALKFILN